MMLFVGNSQKVYMIDKAEGNQAQINGHPAWGSMWDINTHNADLMDIRTNVFCASGMHLPNGSVVTFGGNGAVGPGGNIGSQVNAAGSGAWDSQYQDFDGAQAIRILNPCTENFSDPSCQWYDNPSVLSMQKRRWYSAAEALPDGSIILIGGFVNGGYINRNTPNNDPEFSGGAAEPTYEIYPANGTVAQVMQFMIKTSGLNAYALTFLMPSGKLFVQANVSTILFDYTNNVEVDLPDMPNNVVRVYPATGAVTMLPLTPANNYAPTILFCGGSNMSADSYGNYSFPEIDTWDYPASNDCQRITPEPADGSAPVYVQDDDMLEGRTMGQFIILPDGKLLCVNGGLNGTAGYATQTGQTPPGGMPYGMSLAAGPIGTPAIYDPNAPAGSRWSNTGLSSSSIARLYHSSAILLPDASVLIAGSNPNVDVNLTTVYPTTYKAEIFYPSYFAASTRPVPTGVPSTISYGGNPFDITVPSSSYSGSANDAATNTTVSIIRPGFTTHAMNMGQRYLQLNNTFTVNSDGSITLHVAQAPPIPNIFQPGPAMLFVTINGIPSNATMVIVGTGYFGTQPTAPASVLPNSALLSSASGSGNGSSTSSTSIAGKEPASHTAEIVGGIIGAVVVIGFIGALVGICISRRRAANRLAPSAAYARTNKIGGLEGGAGGADAMAMDARGVRNSDSSAFVPLQQENYSSAWNASNVSVNSPYPQAYRDGDDDVASGRPSGMGMSMEFDPYSSTPRTTSGGPRY